MFRINTKPGRDKNVPACLLFIAFFIAVLAAHFILPHFFDRMRIAEGSLGILIICTGLAGPFSSVFSTALQGLKKFKMIALFNAIGSPVRLVVMLVAMPFRALAGYMLGQLSAPAVTIFVSIFSLRKTLGKNVQAIPLGREDVKAMVRYTLPVAFNLLVATVMGTWQALLIRQRLPEVESAGFYIISRLAEVAAYAGMSLSVVVFPLAARWRLKRARRVKTGTDFCGGLWVALCFPGWRSRFCLLASGNRFFPPFRFGGIMFRMDRFWRSTHCAWRSAPLTACFQPTRLRRGGLPSFGTGYLLHFLRRGCLWL